MKLAIAILISAALVVGCSDRNTSVPATNHELVITPTTKPISQEERDAIIAGTTNGLELERDKMEKISFYNSPGFNIDEQLIAYNSLPDGSPPILRIYIRYYGNSWIFFDKVKVMSDDSIVYEKGFSHSGVTRDNGSSAVWETVDFAGELDDIAAIRRVAAAKKSTIRLSGG